MSRSLRHLGCLLLIAASSCVPWAGGLQTPMRGLGEVHPQAESALLRTLHGQADGVRSMRALLKGTLGAAGVRRSFSQVVVFHRPDQLRVELFATQLNRLLSLLLADKGELEAYVPAQDRIYRGKATPANVARLLRVPFSPEEMMLWLNGVLLIPGEEELASTVVLRSEDRRRLLVDLLLRDGRRVLGSYYSAAAEPMGFRLQTVEILRADDDQPLFFSQFEYGAEEPLPSRIMIEIPPESLSGELRFVERELNPLLDAGERNRLFGSRVSAAEVLPLAEAGEPLL